MSIAWNRFCPCDQEKVFCLWRLSMKPVHEKFEQGILFGTELLRSHCYCSIAKRTTVFSNEASQRPELQTDGRQLRSVVPDINFLWLDKAGCSDWFSWWKHSQIFICIRPCLLCIVFDFVHPSLVNHFFKSAGCLLLNIYGFTFGITPHNKHRW